MSRTIQPPPRLRETDPEYQSRHDALPPSPTGSTDTPVFITPRSDTPISTSMSGMSLYSFHNVNHIVDSWVAVTPNSDDEQPRLLQRLVTHVMTPDLALAVEGLRIHE